MFLKMLHLKVKNMNGVGVIPSFVKCQVYGERLTVSDRGRMERDSERRPSVWPDKGKNLVRREECDRPEGWGDTDQLALIESLEFGVGDRNGTLGCESVPGTDTR